MSKVSILIVEDEALIAMELEEQLGRLGYSNISRVFTGEEAIKKTQENHPHLILMGISLGGEIDGLEASEVICTRSNIPVIYITGSSETTLQKRLQEANFTHTYSYIIKPFDEEQLREKIDAVLGKPFSPK